MSRRITRTVLLALSLVAAIPTITTPRGSEARAQSTVSDTVVRNDELLSRFVIDCLQGQAVSDAIAIVFPPEVAFAATAFAASRLGAGQTVWIESSIEAARAERDGPRAASVEMQVDQAGVDYRRSGRRELERTVTFHARYMVRNISGSVVTADRCDATHSDVVTRADVPTIELEAFPITRGDVPGPGGARRLVAPVVAGAAAAVSAYLLFSLRSDSGS